MAGPGSLDGELAASYSVEIVGIERTRKEMAALDGVIREIRAGNYSSKGSVTVASSLGSQDVFVSRFDELMGRVQTKATQAMVEAMDFGKKTQQDALRAATTPTGLAGKSHVGGRRGPGRDDSGDMIDSVTRNVEVFKTATTTLITGWHGWGADDRPEKIDAQEKGTRARRGVSGVRAGRVKAKKGHNNRGIPAANSLGAAIVPTREKLKRALGGLKK